MRYLLKKTDASKLNSRYGLISISCVKHSNFLFFLNSSNLTLYAHQATRAAFTESALAPPSRCRGFSRILSLQQNLEEFWGLTMSIKIALYSSWNKLSIGWYFEYGFHMKISRKTWLKSCPRVSERNSIMAEIASESESYLSRNESDPDSVFVYIVSVSLAAVAHKKENVERWKWRPKARWNWKGCLNLVTWIGRWVWTFEQFTVDVCIDNFESNAMPMGQRIAFDRVTL